jgi:Ca2+-transporting ATPase
MSSNETFQFTSRTAEEACEILDTNPHSGLTQNQVLLLQTKGRNELDLARQETMIDKFIEQFQNPLILLLLGSAFVSFLVGQYDDSISIVITVIIVLTVAFVQEYQSMQSLEALNRLAPPTCHCIRNGHAIEIMASELVPGDVIRFGRGDRIPADARLLQAVALDVDESNLTGENEPTRKTDHVIHSFESGATFAEKKNIVFMGTLVRNGHGQAVVFGTGNNTELGAVMKLVSEVVLIDID